MSILNRMRIVCLVNALHISRYAFLPLEKDSSAFSMVLAYARSIPGVEKIGIICEENAELPDLSISFEMLPLSGGSRRQALLDVMIQASEGFDAILFAPGDCPMLDAGLTVKMLENHKRYFAEYSFADGFPYGLAPEIVKPGILPPLKKLDAGEKGIPRDFLFSLIQKDINAFEIETELSPKDMRLLRISLSCDTLRNYRMVRDIMGFHAKSVPELLETIGERQEALRQTPAFFNIQIVEGCMQACSYCPYPLFGGDILTNRGYMDPEDFNRILRQIEDLAEDAVISLSLWGEPCLHPRLPELITAVLSRKGFTLIIETSGLGLSQSTIEAAAKAAQAAMGTGPSAAVSSAAVSSAAVSSAAVSSAGTEAEKKERLVWIVSLDSVHPDLYKTLRGPGFEDAAAAVDNLFKSFPDQVYVQAVRMTENEDSLEQFFRDWKKRTDRVIIQKYDWFCGFLPQKKVTDLSPVLRFPCWHLKRDISILLDGTVPVCREDVEKRYPLGNVWEDGLAVIWERMGDFYSRHISKDYPDLCEKCDEYYTFNF